WWKRCEDRRRADDHLSLVASITRKQRDRLADQCTTRVTELAALSPSARVPGIEPEPLTRIREQARIQVEGREEKRTKHELLADFDPGSGLEALPKPSPGDLFFDLEGDAFYESTGLEYLFGLVELGQISRSFTERTAAGPPKYLSHWATSRVEEKAAFEAVIDRIQAGRAELADMHVYHFGHREADAVRRLSCFHKTREDAVDDMLRNHVFVDLHRIVRQSLRASVESYSLKLLEPLYGFTRKTEVRDAARAMQLFGRFLELGGPDGSEATRDVIASYNEEDCLSTWKLREFLEAARPRLEAELGRALARPKEASSADDEAQKRRAEKDRVLQEVVADLTRGLPEDAAEDSDEAGARRLLSVLLDFHWREAKSGWWEYYRAAELAPSERLEDSAALAGLQFVSVVEEVNRSAIYRYAFPQQRHAIRTRGSVDPDSHEDPNKFKSVNVVAIGEQHVDIKRQRSREREHPSALIPGGPINTEILKESLLELGRQVVAAADGDVGTAAWDLLRRHPPRLTSGAASSAALQLPGESEAQALLRMVPLLDGSVLSMQGPPGSGKTYLAAQLIGHLVEQGQRVGVTAGSHSVIRNLLDKAVEIGAVAAQRVAHHGGSSDDASVDDDDDTIARSTDYKKLRATLDSGKVVLVGGTAWAWANDA
ncbi:MAG TPA: TM0106 family RecB-like putative nuclease, partial [Polyangiaceae bacterium]|nr:TM0106 family RecB-like putative nuclease [Polyangiaceae bacterium]